MSISQVRKPTSPLSRQRSNALDRSNPRHAGEAGQREATAQRCYLPAERHARKSAIKRPVTAGSGDKPMDRLELDMLISCHFTRLVLRAPTSGHERRLPVSPITSTSQQILHRVSRQCSIDPSKPENVKGAKNGLRGSHRVRALDVDAWCNGHVDVLWADLQPPSLIREMLAAHPSLEA